MVHFRPDGLKRVLSSQIDENDNNLIEDDVTVELIDHALNAFIPFTDKDNHVSTQNDDDNKQILNLDIDSTQLNAVIGESIESRVNITMTSEYYKILSTINDNNLSMAILQFNPNPIF